MIDLLQFLVGGTYVLTGFYVLTKFMFSDAIDYMVRTNLPNDYYSVYSTVNKQDLVNYEFILDKVDSYNPKMDMSNPFLGK